MREFITETLPEQVFMHVGREKRLSSIKEALESGKTSAPKLLDWQRDNLEGVIIQRSGASESPEGIGEIKVQFRNGETRNFMNEGEMVQWANDYLGIIDRIDDSGVRRPYIGKDIYQIIKDEEIKLPN